MARENVVQSLADEAHCQYLTNITHATAYGLESWSYQSHDFMSKAVDNLWVNLDQQNFRCDVRMNDNNK